MIEHDKTKIKQIRVGMPVLGRIATLNRVVEEVVIDCVIVQNLLLLPLVSDYTSLSCHVTRTPFLQAEHTYFSDPSYEACHVTCFGQ